MYETFGERLKKLRDEHDLTMDELSNLINKRYPDMALKKSMISRYENNLNVPKQFSTVENLAEFFGVHINYMSGKSNDKYDGNVQYKKVPILGTIAAGIPILAHEDIIDYEYVSPCEDVDYCLKVKGDSMIGIRIFDGDTVFVRKQSEVENGEIAVIQIDNENVTLKRFYKENNRIVLHSENPTMKDIIILAKDRKTINILGRVVYVKFKVK